MKALLNAASALYPTRAAISPTVAFSLSSRLAASPKIKPESEWKLLGKPLPRVELPAKLNGTAVFGMDFRLPGMVHAAVKQSPAHGGTVASFDKSSVMGMPGVIDVAPIPNGVAVVAGQYWQASQALKSLKVAFNAGDAGANANVSADSLNAQYRAALDGNVWKTVKTEGKAMSGEAMAGQFAEVYSQEYKSQFLAHATMEPMNCTAHTTADSCTVWGPLQADGGSLYVTQEGREKVVQLALGSLSSTDARKLAELDRYVVQTREDVYRSFEALDVRRRELELARVHSQSRFQESPESHNLTTGHTVRLSVARVAESQSVFFLNRTLPVTTIRDGREPEIQVGMSSDVSLPVYIQSDREWRFDSLREALNRTLGTPPNEIPALIRIASGACPIVTIGILTSFDGCVT